jgi:hypothetical protein
LEIVHCGRALYLTYVSEGLNEFWSLNGDKASQVTLDGRPLSLRARITRLGDFAYIYGGDSTGKAYIYRVVDGVATALKLDSVDRGTLSYAWEAWGSLLLGYYKDGTYDFYTLKEETLTPAWPRNGEQDYDQQVDVVDDLPGGDDLYLDVTYRNQTHGAWYFNGTKLEALKQHWGKTYVLSTMGLYFIGENGLMRAVGASVQELKTSAKPTSLTCRGASVLATNETAAWLIYGSDSVEVPTGAELVAFVQSTDILRVGTKFIFYREGKPAGELPLPEDFGQIERTLGRGHAAYVLERTDDSAFRMWRLGH